MFLENKANIATPICPTKDISNATLSISVLLTEVCEDKSSLPLLGKPSIKYNNYKYNIEKEQY